MVSVKVFPMSISWSASGLLLEYSQKVFEAYWGDLADISDEAILDNMALR